MKTIARLLLCAAVAFALAAFPAAALAIPDEAFTITSYDVRVQVSGSNTYSVDETIAVDFTEQRHGIFRDIPVGDGSTVQDVSVEGGDFTVENSADTVEIRIGNPDVLVDSAQTSSRSGRRFASVRRPGICRGHRRRGGAGRQEPVCGRHERNHKPGLPADAFQ